MAQHEWYIECKYSGRGRWVPLFADPDKRIVQEQRRMYEKNQPQDQHRIRKWAPVPGTEEE